MTFIVLFRESINSFLLMFMFRDVLQGPTPSLKDLLFLRESIGEEKRPIKLVYWTPGCSQDRKEINEGYKTGRKNKDGKYSPNERNIIISL